MSWIKIGGILIDTSKYSRFSKGESNFTMGNDEKYYWIETDTGQTICHFIGDKKAKEGRDLAFERLIDHLNAKEI